MKNFKNVLFLLLVTTFLLSCGGNGAETSTDNADSTSTEASTGTEETSSTNTTETGTVDETGKITSAIVDKACSCVNQAKEGGSTELSEIIPKIQECMGGNSEEFVKGLLGPDANDKQVADALKTLKEKMKSKCPLQ